MKLTRLIPWLLLVVVLSLPLWLTPTPITVKTLTAIDVLQLISSLFVVALFMERGLEVFVSTWRGPQEEALQLNIKFASDKLQTGNTSERAPATEALQTAQQALTEYKSRTKVIAMWVGLICGLLISAVGIRSLHILVDSNGISELSQIQSHAFHLVDVFVTGGVIAGGSDGIHKLTKIYTDFMERTSSRIKDGE